MPGGDRTGPNGMGPMTGRGVGICAGYDVPGSMTPSFRHGFGGGRGRGMGRNFGMGGGRGWRNQYYATGLPGWARGQRNPYPSPVAHSATATLEAARTEELSHLKEQAQYFKGILNDIESRVNELQKEAVSNKKNQE